MCINKTHLLLISLLFVVSGCMKVDTDPKPIFNEVKEVVTKLTDQQIYWDHSVYESVEILSVEDLLQNELTDEFAVRIALLNNPSLQGDYESLGIAKANLAQAGLLKNPIFSLAYKFSTTPSVTSLIDTGLIQNFLEILLIPLKKKIAHSELEATKAKLIAKIFDVILKTKIAFFSLQAAEQVWELQKQMLLAAELSFEAAQKLFEVGNIKELEMLFNRSLYEHAKLEVASGEVAILEAREKLNVLMGLWGDQIEWKAFNFLPEIPTQEVDFRNIENDAILKSLELKISYNKLLATAATFGIDTSKLIFPQFDAGIMAEREDSVWYVGPAFNIAIPLFDFGKANSVKAEATIMKQWNEYTALAIEIRSKARLARISLLNTYRQSLYLQKVIVPLAEEITHSVLLQHNAMQLGVFHLLRAKKDELEKKIQLMQMKKAYWISRVSIQTFLNGHAVGLGTVGDANE